ncbi:MAG: enoyl-CoA hydratase [Deltaproteobacteria bacterium]|nr:enoyl-CoA hydratase [Deltaproteobacteria bacterium]
MPPRAPRRALDVSLAGGVTTLTIRDGDAGLSRELHAALADAAGAIDLDDAVRVVVLRSRGRSFCRGGVRDAEPGVPDGVAAIAALRVPVLCLVHGDALDDGLELALACDLRLAAVGARLGVTQLAAGRLPHHGATQRLPRAVGRGRALSMLLLGECLTARAACAAGLVHRVCAARELWRAGQRLAAEIGARAPIAQRLAKEALRAASDLPLAEGLRLEGDLYVLLQSTADRDEGITSFRERRKPVFRGH